MRYNKIASTREVNESPDQQSRFTIVSKELQTTTWGLSIKQSLFKHRYTLREGERERERERAVSESGQFQRSEASPKQSLSKQRYTQRARERARAAVFAKCKQPSCTGLRALLRSILQGGRGAWQGIVIWVQSYGTSLLLRMLSPLNR